MRLRLRQEEHGRTGAMAKTRKSSTAAFAFAAAIALILCAAYLAGCGTVETDTEQAASTQGGSRMQATDADSGASYAIEEIWVDDEGQRIYGEAYIPAGEGPYPLVILSHGFGGSHSSMAAYAQVLAESGYAAYVLDFRGGTVGGNLSDGESTGMSVMTEADDLEAVIAASASWDFADHAATVLAGQSQGGFVSAVVAARDPQAAQALVLLYPAFSIVDDAHGRFGSPDRVPEEYGPFGSWFTVGRNYATDVWDYDVYGEIGNYTGPVLIEHGDQDATVDVRYSYRAAEVYPDATLKVYEGAGHGFQGGYFEESVDDMIEFLDENVDG